MSQHAREHPEWRPGDGFYLSGSPEQQAESQRLLDQAKIEHELFLQSYPFREEIVMNPQSELTKIRNIPTGRWLVVRTWPNSSRDQLVGDVRTEREADALIARESATE